MMLTVKVKAGTKTIKALRGYDVPMIVAPTAKVRVAIAHKWLHGATLADVAVGARVKVRGTISVDSTRPGQPGRGVHCHERQGVAAGRRSGADSLSQG